MKIKKVSLFLGTVAMTAMIFTSCASAEKKETNVATVNTDNNEILSETKKDIHSANNIYIFKDMACNDAPCKCNECYYKFIDEDGKELIINEINEKSTSIKLYETIEHNDEGGWIELIPNKKYVNKKFKITYSVTKCECDGIKLNNNYKKLTSIKILE